MYLSAISKYKSLGAYIQRSNLTGGFLRYEFRRLVFGGAYFRNFTVLVKLFIHLSDCPIVINVLAIPFLPPLEIDGLIILLCYSFMFICELTFSSTFIWATHGSVLNRSLAAGKNCCIVALKAPANQTK